MRDDTRDLQNAIDQQSIHWEATIPLMDLRPVATQVAKKSAWVRANQAISLLKLAVNRLYRLRSSAMGETLVVVSRDLRRIALISVPSRQRKLGLGSASNGETANGNGDELDDETLPEKEVVEQASKKALDVADGITVAREKGEMKNAEQFINLVARSPDQAQTIRMLRVNGQYPVDVASGGRRLTTGGRSRFPRRLETEFEFRVVLHEFSDINDTHTKAFVKAVNESVSNEIARTAFSLRRNYKLHIGSSADAFLVRQIALSGHPVEMLVTGSLLIAENVIDELTLVKVTNKNTLRPVVKRINTQLELDLASS